MSLLIKIIELILIFIIIRSFLKMVYIKKEKKNRSFAKNTKEDISSFFNVKEQDIVDADYEEIE